MDRVPGFNMAFFGGDKQQYTVRQLNQMQLKWRPWNDVAYSVDDGENVRPE